MLILGGTGGLGSQLLNILSSKYNITSIGSKDLDIRNKNDCENYFKSNKFVDKLFARTTIMYRRNVILYALSKKTSSCVLIDLSRNLSIRYYYE